MAAYWGGVVMDLTKKKPFRSREYLAWVRTLPCSVCESPETVAHHIIGIGQGCMGSKASDLYTMPLCHQHHHELHHDGKYIDMQWAFVAKTLATAAEADYEAVSILSV